MSRRSQHGGGPTEQASKPCSESDGALLQGKPLRTWRPMALWTAALLLALGLVWFVAAVAVPAWRTRAIVRDYRQDTHSWSLLLPHEGLVYPKDWDDLSRRPRALEAIARLGGPKSAEALLPLYLRMPDWWSTEKIPAVELLWYCGPEATPPLEKLLRHRDPKVRSAAAEALKWIKDREPGP